MRNNVNTSCKPIVKFGLTKHSISSILQKEVRYGPRYLGGIGLFETSVIRGAVQIAFLIEHFWKPNPSSPLIRSNLYTLQFEVGLGSSILENNYPKTRQ